MTENAPPGITNAASDAASRGMPYYERLRRDLRESLQKKRILDNNLVGTKDGTFQRIALTLCVATTRRQHPASRNTIS